MAASLAGDQWNEGDVSCSVVRRVLLPDACLAADGLLEAFLTVLGQMEVHPGAIARESRHHLPFLLTTTLLMEAVKAGAGRESAHEAIKEHAVEVARALRAGEIGRNDLLERLAGDPRLRLDRARVEAVLARAPELTGSAGAQVDAFAAEAAAWTARVPESAGVRPGRIL
jgi:adenylosuccinate lyase